MIDAENFAQAETLKNGVSVEIRSIRPDDKAGLTEAFQNLEPESIYTRFFHHKKGMSESELRTATEVDFDIVVALVVTTKTEEGEIIIAGGRYFVLDERETLLKAEVAFTVEEDYHGQGIAGLLLKHLIRIARYKGLAHLVAEVLPENRGMLRVFSRSGLPMKETRDGGVTHVTMDLAENVA